MRNKAEVRNLRFERLETRSMLAGNVTAVVFGGQLMIKGDNLDNDITIDQTALVAGELRVGSGADTTTINKGAGPVVFSGITRGVRVSLGNGNDNLRITDAAIRGDVTIDNGKGNNAVSIDDHSRVEGNVAVNNSSGYDDFSLISSTVTKNIKLTNGNGGSDAFILASRIYGNMTVKNGDGFDSFRLTDTSVGKDLKLDNGRGGGFTDLLECAIGRDVTFRAGNGHDTFILEDALVGDDVSVKTGDGGSAITVRLGGEDTRRAQIGRDLTIETGRGVDSIVLEAVEVYNRTRVHTGREADNLTLSESIFHGNASLDGGLGVNTLLDTGDNIFRKRLTIRRFV